MPPRCNTRHGNYGSREKMTLMDDGLGSQVAELKAAISIKDAALQASAVALQAKEAIIQSKDAVIEGKNALLQNKDAELRAMHTLIQRLQAELVPARAAAAAAHAPAPLDDKMQGRKRKRSRGGGEDERLSPFLSPDFAAKADAKSTSVAGAAAAPAALFPFSPLGQHKYSELELSRDRLTVKWPRGYGYAWARSERGAAAGCGVVKWALQLGKNGGDDTFTVGVASDFFSGYTEQDPVLSWYFQNENYVGDAEPFAAGDVVTVELERAPGVYGVLRVRVAGKTPQEKRGLPMNGMLYPIVCLSNMYQRYTMVNVP
jgi:hypothetical protein